MAMTLEQMAAQIAELQATNAALVAKSTARQHFTCKVSVKGALSVYGLGRFPVTLYRGQWERLIAESGKVTEFIKANEAALKVKE